MMILNMLVVLLLALGACAHAEPAAKPGASFAVPFNHWAPRRGLNLPDKCEGLCLTGSFDPGLHVVLINKKGACTAKTGERCTWQDPYHEPAKGTKLSGTAECFTAWATEETLLGSFDIAVVGADPAKVRLVPLNEDRSPLLKDMELEARRLIEPSETEGDLCGVKRFEVSIADSPPRVYRVGDATLLIFRQTSPRVDSEYGPAVLLLNRNFFRLCGRFTFEHFFFLVDDKLHLLQKENTCGACGEQLFVVYDLSETPKVVYENSDFSD